jgi:hypothetical protein
VRDENDRPELQLCEDGVEVADLIVGGVRVGGRLIRTAPPEKIKRDNPARRREVGEETVESPSPSLVSFPRLLFSLSTLQAI